jgi:DNA polymerase III alpha subunit
MTYVDLQVTTNYSFLRGASFPREMVTENRYRWYVHGVFA